MARTLKKIAPLQEPAIVCGGYVRSSRVERDEEKVSPEMQEKEFTRYAEHKGWILPPEHIKYDLNKSAFRIHYSRRKGLMELLEMAQRGKIKKLLVYKFSRFGRKYFQELVDKFEEAGCDVVSVREDIDISTPAGRMFRNMIGVINQFYSEDTSEWITDSQETNILNGRFNGGREFYGAVWNPEQKVFEKDPVNARVVLTLFKKRVDGYGRELLVKMLHNSPEVFGCFSSVPSPAGGEWWDGTSVAYLLSNVKYIGLLQRGGLYYGGERINCPVILDGTEYSNWEDYLIRKHELSPEDARAQVEGALKRDYWAIPSPIVPLSLWNQAQRVILADKARHSRVKSSPHLLSGLICDARNGAPYQVKTQDQDHPPRYINKIRKLRGPTACNSKMLDGGSVEKRIVTEVLTLAQDDDFWGEIRSQYLALSREAAPTLDRKRMEKEIKTLEQALHQLEDDRYRKQVISAEQFARLNKQYLADLEELKRKLITMDTPEVEVLANIDTFQATIQNLAEAWQELDLVESRAALRAVIKKILVHEDHLTLDGNFFTREIYPIYSTDHVMFF
ncbi:recombinase family protein [Desulfotomaculum copahuensis]|uniref:Resolvase/invertase-type recombinase catalytic domain-containing protein n=1 Tax=Desulfotomaculum copahuensis TaxID=1838280 RepID=A0A1B7LBZ2_9FIRM|nr:recombinase family protein [Desulfotomaculum copahuensis]OAT80258.1 hypothetical protein A6M21_13965 [Desulfotomaculum copahuensis]